MALNITFTGNIYDAAGNIVTDNVKYQAFFQKVNTTSSSSRYNLEKVSELGQYSINLGDGDWLTQEGAVANGDKVALLFWKEKSESKLSTTLKEWCVLEIALNGTELYINDIKLSSGIKPNNNFIRSGANRVGKTVVISDNGSNDEHTFTYNGKTFKQSKVYFVGMNTLPANSVSINWGDGTIETKNPGTAYNHSYTSPGIYDVVITLTNTFGLSSTSHISVQIYWNEPIVDFNINALNFEPQGRNGLGEDVICNNISSDPDNRNDIDKWYYDWNFTTATFLNKNKSYSPLYNCTSVGYHNISLICHWYDGFAWQTKTATKQIYQNQWTIHQGLLWDEPVYINKENAYLVEASGDTQYINTISAYINGVLKYTPNLGDIFLHTFTTSEPQSIKIEINYNNGFEDIKIEETYIIKMSTLCSFSHETLDQGIKFVSTSIAGSPPFIKYAWYVYDTSTNILMAEHIGIDKNEFIYTLFKEGEYKIRLEVTDSANIMSFAEGKFLQQFTAGGERVIYVAEILNIEIDSEEIDIEIPDEIIDVEIEDNTIDIVVSDDIIQIQVEE